MVTPLVPSMSTQPDDALLDQTSKDGRQTTRHDVELIQGRQSPEINWAGKPQDGAKFWDVFFQRWLNHEQIVAGNSMY